MTNRFSSALVLAALLLSGLPGCAGYRLGTMLPDDIKSVFIPTFVNKTTEPLLEEDTTGSTVSEFQKDGSLEVADESSADTVLTVTLTNYILTPIAYQKNKKTAAQEYRLTILAAITLTRRSDNSVIAQNPRVKGETTFQLIGDLSSSKLQALPNAADDLAHNIVEKVVEAWQ